MKYWLAVAAGGAGGALMRYGIYQLMASYSDRFQWGQLLANFAGCLAIGILFPLMSKWDDQAHGLIVVGFLGALTTMSAFSMEVQRLIVDKRMLDAGIFWSLSTVGCVLMTWCGVFLGMRFLKS